jgi:hypothetical protein
VSRVLLNNFYFANLVVSRDLHLQQLQLYRGASERVSCRVFAARVEQ